MLVGIDFKKAIMASVYITGNDERLGAAIQLPRFEYTFEYDSELWVITTLANCVGSDTYLHGMISSKFKGPDFKSALDRGYLSTFTSHNMRLLVLAYKASDIKKVRGFYMKYRAKGGVSDLIIDSPTVGKYTISTDRDVSMMDLLIDELYDTDKLSLITQIKVICKLNPAVNEIHTYKVEGGSTVSSMALTSKDKTALLGARIK